ncbi:MAG: HlyD family efflux transporter periplasmic adaptor subunit [Clostridia bacterium]|nr:HlyD family efflux transporter periplasmic adaptor subunit [Clostridia bacterium]
MNNLISGRRRVQERTAAERALNLFMLAVAIAVVAVLSYVLLATIRGNLAGRFTQAAVARNGFIEISIPARAVIVRDESVAITPISGVLHYAVGEGEMAAPGTVVAEIRDQSATGTPKQQPSESNDNANRSAVDSSLRERRERERISTIRVQMALKEEEAKAYEERKDTKNANKARSELSALRAREREAESSLARIQEESRAAAAEAASAKSESNAASARASAVLRASESALISRHMDGLESVYRPGNPDLLNADPGAPGAVSRDCAEGEQVSAGMAVFREVQNYQTNLVIFANYREGAAPRRAQRVRVRFPRLASEAVGATILETRKREDLGDNTWAIHVAMDRYAASLTNLRTERVDLVTDYVGGVVVPESALVRTGDSDAVYVLRSDRYTLKKVSVLGRNGSEAVVEGIREGDRVRVRL